MAYNASAFEDPPDIWLIIVHGNFMLFGVLVLIPVGKFVARYYKETWTMTFFNTPIWQLVHMAYMIAAAVILTVGIIFAELQDPPLKISHAHSIVGWILYVLFLIQGSVGILLQRIGENIRKYVRILHGLFGEILSFVLLIIAMLSGDMIVARYPYFSSVVIFTWMVFSLAMHAALAYLLHEASKEFLSIDKDSYYTYYRTYLPLPTPKIEKTPRGANLRLVLYLWMQFGCAAAFSIICITYSEASLEYSCKDWFIFQATCDLN